MLRGIPLRTRDHSVADLTTGLLNGTFSMTFANGDMLSGNVFEDVSALIATGGMGPFTQKLTFTGGTGEFAGATGSASGGGLGTDTGTTVSGSGTLTAAGVTTPEPASVALILGGAVVLLYEPNYAFGRASFHERTASLIIASWPDESLADFAFSITATPNANDHFRNRSALTAK